MPNHRIWPLDKSDQGRVCAEPWCPARAAFLTMIDYVSGDGRPAKHIRHRCPAHAAAFARRHDLDVPKSQG